MSTILIIHLLEFVALICRLIGLCVQLVNMETEYIFYQALCFPKSCVQCKYREDRQNDNYCALESLVLKLSELIPIILKKTTTCVMIFLNLWLGISHHWPAINRWSHISFVSSVSQPTADPILNSKRSTSSLFSNMVKLLSVKWKINQSQIISLHLWLLRWRCLFLGNRAIMESTSWPISLLWLFLL